MLIPCKFRYSQSAAVRRSAGTSDNRLPPSRSDIASGRRQGTYLFLKPIRFADRGPVALEGDSRNTEQSLESWPWSGKIAPDGLYRSE
jgi:hypothetical protein